MGNIKFKGATSSNYLLNSLEFEALYKYKTSSDNTVSKNVIYSAGILILKNQLQQIENSDFYTILNNKSLAQKIAANNTNEKFYKEPVSNSLGSCFAYSNDLIVTSKHVIYKLVHQYEISLREIVVVYGFNNNNNNNNIIYNNNIYVLKYDYKNTLEHNSDFVILKVEGFKNKHQLISDKYIATCEHNDMNYKQWDLFMAGYPYGMPLKISIKGKIRNKYMSDNCLYHTDLNAYQYTSGSPVFNQYHNVIGIIDQSNSDFIPNTGKINEELYDEEKGVYTSVVPIKYILKIINQ